MPNAREQFEKRAYLLAMHYKISDVPQLTRRSWFFERANMGVYAAWQTHEQMLFEHASERPGGMDLISHPPFGAKAVAPGVPVDRLPTAIARAIDANPSNLLKINPPLTVYSVNEDDESVIIRNDLLGLGKTFLLRREGVTAVSSRPLAAHLLSGLLPEPSSVGWAAEQLHGWFVGDNSPFRDMRRVLGGTSITFNRQQVEETRHNLVGRWFTEPAEGSAFQGFERYASEFAEFTNTPNIDVALSGGRDSRASGAIASCFFPDKVGFRTNEPPVLEGLVARQLIERLPFFASFADGEKMAYNAAGKRIWKASTPEINEVKVHARAKAWALVGEGVVAAASIYSNAPSSGVFRMQGNPAISFSGVAGESAKAYYWSPRMVSGTYARNMSQFYEDVRLPVSERIKTHPLTTQSKWPFIRADYREKLRGMIWEGQREATGLGIHGYRFLDYWWFSNRMAGATTVAYSGDATMIPLLTPEFTAQAMQGTPTERAQALLLREIVGHFRPEWKDVKYFDELQLDAPKEHVRSYRERSLVWEGDLAADFLAMIDGSEAFEEPYDRAAMIDLFHSADIAQNVKAGLNHKALGLVHRHAFHAMCKDISDLIRSRDLQIPPGGPAARMLGTAATGGAATAT